MSISSIESIGLVQTRQTHHNSPGPWKPRPSGCLTHSSPKCNQSYRKQAIKPGQATASQLCCTIYTIYNSANFKVWLLQRSLKITRKPVEILSALVHNQFITDQFDNKGTVNLVKVSQLFREDHELLLHLIYR